MPNPVIRCWMGVDPREAAAFRVAQASFHARASAPAGIVKLDMLFLRETGYYTRPIETRNGRLWDTVSAAPMSTNHAIARFLVPFLACNVGWALFTDSDVLWRADPRELFALADPKFAAMVVKHRQPPGASDKMEGEIQTLYPRKNWSSVCLWNCGHPANRRLTHGMVNTMPGLWLHGFQWLADEEIGELPREWNYLVGASEHMENPNLAHFTLGTPDQKGRENQPFAEEWLSFLHTANSRGAHV